MSIFPVYDQPSFTFFLVAIYSLQSLVVGSLLFYFILALVAPQKIEDHYVWLTCLNANYLEQFPEWHATR